MAINKETENFGVPWEAGYGYAQATKIGHAIYLSGQVSHDEAGNIVGEGDMRAQMAQAYKNVKALLARYGATMDNVVDEVLFVTDMESAFAAAGECRAQAFGGPPVVSSTIVQIQALAMPAFMIEIKCVAIL